MSHFKRKARSLTFFCYDHRQADKICAPMQDAFISVCAEVTVNKGSVTLSFNV